jgi:ADP-ribose pyrophosphatase YjhB (NUDIX family)
LTSDPKWLEWARQLQTIAQAGLTYAQDTFDIERYEAIRRLAAEMLAAQANADLTAVQNLFAGEYGHPTPKVDVRGAIFKDDTILLVKERADGGWTLPGGWADINESPAQAVVREVYEESGYQTRAVKLLALYDRRLHDHPPHPWHIYKLFFQCDLVGGAPTISGETDDVAFFKPSEIPQLSVARVTAAQIARFFDHYRHPEWPTDFD